MALSQKAEEQKKQSKKGTRPASSQPGQPSREKQQALQLNLRLKEQLEEAKQKLAASEDQLRKEAPENNTFYLSAEPFELVLTKQEAEEFTGEHSRPNGWLNPSRPQKSQGSLPESLLEEIRELLTYRMKYNRYSFA
jgi:hypothetical protein